MTDDWDEEWDEPEEDDDSPAEVLPCPACGIDVYEDADQCPACGEYIVHGSRVWEQKPWWWILLGLAGVVAVIWTFVA